MRFPLPLLGLLALTLRVAAQQHVASTDARSPEDERKSFTLPPGFVAELVASEPDVQKPMQMAFDAKGRLWVTTSHHYPFAVEDAKATDKLFVLSDFAADGKAGKVAVFAANLNIPIGVLPLGDGRECIVSSAGRILKLSDTDGDGKADRTTVLFAGFGFRDTHGMTNSFTLMPDGWVYACHGFSNESKVRGADGHEVVMHSGHTFRFRPDGSRIEVFTRGQVNPFGMTADPWGNLYTADCHSKPITQLIRGAYYDSFGKPHDGLGYAPHVTKHDHGSTGLCGLSYYTGGAFPEKYRGTMFLGNVVTNRINHDTLTWKGSTPVAVEQPDFLVSGDPWFRPTDIKVGPDGALYVSDFYNKIIGHYEVDLKHPGRDKDRGRIWRVRYTGEVERAGSLKLKALPGTLREWATEFQLSDARRAVAHEAVRGRSDTRAVRAAVDLLTVHPHPSDVAPLIELLANTPAEDTHLRHAARICLRDHLYYHEPWGKAVGAVGSDPVRQKLLDGVMLGSTTPYAAWWLSERLYAGTIDAGVAVAAAEHVGRHGSAADRNTAFAGVTAVGERKRMTELANAFYRGTGAAGVNFTPGPAREPASIARLSPGQRVEVAPNAVAQKVMAGLASNDDTVVRETLEQAAALRIDVAREAFGLLASGRSEPVRVAAFAVLEQTARERLLPTCGDLFRDPATPPRLKDRALGLVATSRKLSDLIVLKDALKDLPYRQAVTVATGLAGSPEGADLLFAEVKAGRASARLLQEKAVLDRLTAANVRDRDARVEALTAGIPSADARVTALLKQRGDGFKAAKPDAAKGKAVYATNCAACHQLAGQGGKVGPNLDGVGTRGADRLCEDVLDPNRNVDAAFRTTQLNLTDGRVLSGLLLREEGAVLVLSDALGKEVRVPAADVDKKRVLNTSPMPADWGDKLPADDFYHLLAFLLDQRAKQ